jgi:hypothetical protein
MKFFLRKYLLWVAVQPIQSNMARLASFPSGLQALLLHVPQVAIVCGISSTVDLPFPFSWSILVTVVLHLASQAEVYFLELKIENIKWTHCLFYFLKKTQQFP